MVSRSSVLLVLAGILAGCSTMAGDSHAAPYSALFGYTYRTTRDLYLFQSTIDPNFHYLGSRTVSTGSRLTDLPNRVNCDEIGAAHDTITLEAIVPAGAKFRIDAETHEVNVASGAGIGLLAELRYAGEIVPIVNLEFIQTLARAADGRPNPAIDPTAAVRESAP